MITFNKVDNNYEIYYTNGAFMGTLEQTDSGYYGYWPNKDRHGYWNSYAMKVIACKLDELNEQYDIYFKENL